MINVIKPHLPNKEKCKKYFDNVYANDYVTKYRSIDHAVCLCHHYFARDFENALEDWVKFLHLENEKKE